MEKQKYLFCAVVVLMITILNAKSFAQRTNRQVLITNQSSEDIKIAFGYHFINHVVFTDSLSIACGDSRSFLMDTLQSGVYYIEFQHRMLYSFFWSVKDTGNLTIEFKNTPQPNVQPHHTQFYNQLNRNANNNIDLHTLAATFSDTLLIDYCKALLPPKRITSSQLDTYKQTQTSSFEIQVDYYKKHYFDSINFENIRLAYTPILFEKIDTYLDKVTQQKYEAVIESINHLMLLIPAKSLLYQYVLQHLFLKYQKQKTLPDMNFVYRYLLENYYLNFKATWTNNALRQKISAEFIDINKAQIGFVAPTLTLDDNKNNRVCTQDEWYGSPTFVYFFDYDCPACKRSADQLLKLMPQLKEKGYKLITICIGDELLLWKGYIERGNMPPDALHLFDNSKEQKAGLYYQLKTIPTIFVLDDRGIILHELRSLSGLKEFLKR